jgi:hypothetical protein
MFVFTEGGDGDDIERLRLGNLFEISVFDDVLVSLKRMYPRTFTSITELFDISLDESDRLGQAVQDTFRHKVVQLVNAANEYGMDSISFDQEINVVWLYIEYMGKVGSENWHPKGYIDYVARTNEALSEVERGGYFSRYGQETARDIFGI